MANSIRYHSLSKIADSVSKIEKSCILKGEHFEDLKKVLNSYCANDIYYANKYFACAYQVYRKNGKKILELRILGLKSSMMFAFNAFENGCNYNVRDLTTSLSQSSASIFYSDSYSSKLSKIGNSIYSFLISIIKKYNINELHLETDCIGTMNIVPAVPAIFKYISQNKINMFWLMKNPIKHSPGYIRKINDAYKKYQPNVRCLAIFSKYDKTMLIGRKSILSDQYDFKDCIKTVVLSNNNYKKELQLSKMNNDHAGHNFDDKYLNTAVANFYSKYNDIPDDILITINTEDKKSRYDFQKYHIGNRVSPVFRGICNLLISRLPDYFTSMAVERYLCKRIYKKFNIHIPDQDRYLKKAEISRIEEAKKRGFLGKCLYFFKFYSYKFIYMVVNLILEILIASSVMGSIFLSMFFSLYVITSAIILLVVIYIIQKAYSFN